MKNTTWRAFTMIALLLSNLTAPVVHGAVSIPPSDITPVPTNSLLGRWSTGTGRGQTITVGDGLLLENGIITSTGGGGGAPTNASYITQIPNGSLSNEQALSLLSSGIMRLATGTGVITSLGDPTTVGSAFMFLANPGAITFPRVNSNNSVSLLSSTDLKTALSLVAIASSGSASDLTSGTIPDARFPGTLPAASGVNLTALNASNISSGTMAVARLPALSGGDASTSAGSGTITLATVNSNVGTFGNATTVPAITVNGKGLITAVSNITITGGGNVTNNATLTANNIVLGGGTTVVGISTMSWNATNSTVTIGAAGIGNIIGNVLDVQTGNFVTMNATTLNISTPIDVPSGGSGRPTGTTAYALIATGTTATGAQQTLASGATTEILVGGGAAALPVWTTAIGTGAPARAGSPIFTGNLTLASGTAPTTSAVAATAFDTNAWATSFGAVQVHSGTANTYLVGVEASDTPTNGQVPKWNTGGTITWENDTGGATLTATQVGYGDGSNALTGEAAFNYTAASNTMVVGAVSLGAGGEASSIGALVDAVDGTTPLNNIIQTISAGTAYTLTTSTAALDFGTTDPVLTIANAGTYTIYVNVQTSFAGLSYTNAQSADFKLRRTNNTAADLSGSLFSGHIPVQTLQTALGPSVSIGPIKYTTANTNDSITVFGAISSAVDAGAVTTSACTITAIRHY